MGEMKQPRTGHRAVIGVLFLCLLILAAGYVLQRRQVAEQQQEITLLRQRVEKEHHQAWRDGLYVPFLEERLAAAHEKGTPAEWRQLAEKRQAEKREEQKTRREAGMATFQANREKNKGKGGGR